MIFIPENIGELVPNNYVHAAEMRMDVLIRGASWLVSNVRNKLTTKLQFLSEHDALFSFEIQNPETGVILLSDQLVDFFERCLDRLLFSVSMLKMRECSKSCNILDDSKTNYESFAKIYDARARAGIREFMGTVWRPLDHNDYPTPLQSVAHLLSSNRASLEDVCNVLGSEDLGNQQTEILDILEGTIERYIREAEAEIMESYLARL